MFALFRIVTPSEQFIVRMRTKPLKEQCLGLFLKSVCRTFTERRNVAAGVTRKDPEEEFWLQTF